MKISLALLMLFSFCTFPGEPLFAGSPQEWFVKPSDYEYFMTVTARLNINQLPSNDPDNVIAAFVGDECRGVAKTTGVNGIQLFFLMVYSNINHETISLRCYLAESDQVVNSTSSFSFESESALGSIDEPYAVEAKDSTTLILEEQPHFGKSFNLLNNYPNPFNGVTSIRYSIAQPGFVRLSVYDILGTLVTDLVQDVQQSGAHQIQWDGSDRLGQAVSSGVYIYVLDTGQQVSMKKMTLLK